MVDGVGGDYTANATAIELKKQEMLAMNESIEEYNYRLGRKIGSVNAACNAIDELIDIYNAGNQQELNTASYVESILEHYKAVYAYYRLIEFIDDYKDDDSDWDLQMRALSMDLNGTFEVWSRDRLAELEIERDIYWSFDWKPFESESKAISPKKFDKLLDYFKTRKKSDVIEEFFGDLYDRKDRDYEYAEWRVGSKYDFDKDVQILCA